MIKTDLNNKIKDNRAATQDQHFIMDQQGTQEIQFSQELIQPNRKLKSKHFIQLIRKQTLVKF